MLKTYLGSVVVLMAVVSICFGAIEPITSITTDNPPGSPPYNILSVTIGDYTVQADLLATGTTTFGTIGGTEAPENDDFDINTALNWNLGATPWFTINFGGGFWQNSNGDAPDFILFESGGDSGDQPIFQAVFPDGSFGQTVQFPSSWGPTGYNRIAAVANDAVDMNGQQLHGLAFSITDLLDAAGNPLSADTVILGLKFERGGTDLVSLFAVIPPAVLARDPIPADNATDVRPDIVLGWTPGPVAVRHNLYFGPSWEDVNNASLANPLGVLVAQGLDVSSYDPGGLELGQIYYWRVDEVNNLHPDSPWKGQVWSFMAEPFAYAIQSIVATTNGISDAGAGPENMINGSGLNANDEHSIDAPDMWLASPGADPLWIQYEFDRAYKLHEMLVWNYNVQFELMLGFGLKDVTVEYSADGATWTVLGDVELAQATATSSYTANTTVDFGGVAAKYVRLNVNSGWGPMGQFGLSEVRFLYIPTFAREPQPTDGQVDVAPDTALTWRAGREAAAHEVYLGTDPSTLVLLDTSDQPTMTPDALEFGTVYYWKVNEVNDAEIIGVWESSRWSFATQEFALIDGFESYNDEDDLIFDMWLDGWVNETGSTVGYLEAPFAEKTVVNSGIQSMPLAYDNSAAPFYSEAEKDLGGMNLTGNGADSLRLFVSGLAPGFFEVGDGTILMNAIGTDIWETADEFRFAYKSLTGNGSMIARVDSLDTSTDVWVKAGVMIRQGTGTGSQHSFMPITGSGGNGASWQGRVEEGLASVNQDQDAASPVAVPYWVRIDRSGNSLTGFISPDGENWTQLGDPREVVMTDPVLIGLALTSHNANQATSAQFSNVSFTDNVTGAWQIAEIGAAQAVGNTPAPIYAALEDSAGKVTVVTHPDSALSARSGWTEWLISYSDLTGINLNSVRTLFIGVGDRNNPTAGGTGTIFIDDVGFGKPVAGQ